MVSVDDGRVSEVDILLQTMTIASSVNKKKKKRLFSMEKRIEGEQP